MNIPSDLEINSQKISLLLSFCCARLPQPPMPAFLRRLACSAPVLASGLLRSPNRINEILTHVLVRNCSSATIVLEVGKTMGIRSKAPAFSLIELLVVMSIVAILLAVLLPVLSASRAAAKLSTCSSQQIGRAHV